MRLILLLVLLALAPAYGELEAGKVPPVVALEDKAGGRLDGTPWSSAELTNKVHMVFYVDPDLKDLNEHVGEALKKEDFSSDDFGSFVVINLAATWKPNWIISAVLKSKQKKYPRAVYIRDYDKALVEAWGLPDQSYSVLMFDRAGRLVKHVDGKLSAAQTRDLIEAIKARMPGG